MIMYWVLAWVVVLIHTRGFLCQAEESVGGNGEGEPLGEARRRAAAVSDAFQTAWDGYYEHAFPNDELMPVSGHSSNSRNGWGASAVDALSTAILMEKQDVVDKILDHIPTIDWLEPRGLVNVLETTIRYLGGLLSGYELLSNEYRHLCPDDKKRQVILEQAVYLANNMSFAFNTPSGVPHNHIYLRYRGIGGDGTTVLAAAGSLVLEWTKLADLTGNRTYANLTQRAEEHLLDPQTKWSEPYPGLVGTNINVATGQFLDNKGGWSGWGDSFYEYLIKMYAYDPSRFERYKERWVLAANSTINRLAMHPLTRPDLTFLASYALKERVQRSGHLACFAGGNFILGGTLLGEQRYIDFGLTLTESCEATYRQTVTGIGPESFAWNSPGDEPFPSAKGQKFYSKTGFFIEKGGYPLRPEMLESLYYAYRVTGDRTYQDMSWRAFQAIANATRVGSGFADLLNVNVEGGGGHVDFQESYWFAETLKYAWLIHAVDTPCQVNSSSEQMYVFTTEGHPLQVFRR